MGKITVESSEKSKRQTFPYTSHPAYCAAGKAEVSLRGAIKHEIGQLQKSCVPSYLECIHLPPFQRHPKEWRASLNRMNDEAHILACHHVSYGNHKIRAAPSAKIPTKIPGIRAISIIPSWVEDGFD